MCVLLYLYAECKQAETEQRLFLTRRCGSVPPDPPVSLTEGCELLTFSFFQHVHAAVLSDTESRRSVCKHDVQREPIRSHKPRHGYRVMSLNEKFTSGELIEPNQFDVSGKRLPIILRLHQPNNLVYLPLAGFFF